MPKPKPKRKNETLSDALSALVKALKQSKAPFMLIGGIAVNAYGYERTTRDIDATIRADVISLGSLVELLKKHQIVARIEDFESMARDNFILLLMHRPSKTPIDLALAWVDFEQAACERAPILNFGKTRAPTAHVDDLLVLKGVAWRPRDQNDFAEVYVRNRSKVDLDAVLRQVDSICELLGEHSRRDEITRMLTRLGVQLK